MIKSGSILQSVAVLVMLICGSGFAEIDTFDSTIVTRILKKIGWDTLSVESVVSSPIGIGSVEPLRVTSLNLTRRDGLAAITELPEEVSQLPELVTLSLKGNKLTGLSDTVATLHKLARLDISDNSFTGLPVSIAELPLQVLIADRNRITALPDWIDTLSRLSSLSMVNNLLKTLPATIVRCSTLATLDLDSNMITALPVELAEGTSFRISVDANRLCTVNDTIARWLDTAQLNRDWKASQRCDAVITSTFTEAVTGTVVHLTDTAVKTDVAACRAIELGAVDTDTLDWFTLQRVIKAVSVSFNDCFTAADSNYFLVTFYWEERDSVASGTREPGVYYVNGRTSRYLDGTVDTVHKTVTVRVNREGLYLLTTPSNVAVRHPDHPRVSLRESLKIRTRNGIPELVFSPATTTASTLRVRIFSLNGRRVTEQLLTVPAGIHTLGLGTFTRQLHNAPAVLELSADRLHAVRMVHLLR